MTKLFNFPAHLQEFIRIADFNHYYCWRVVYKEDSQSTLVRLVVDPTMSGLNILLAKGENNLGNIFDILVRSRTNQFSWAADISKLYNMLHLDYSALPFSLFLYHTSMDANIEPDVYVMTVVNKEDLRSVLNWASQAEGWGYFLWASQAEGACQYGENPGL